MFTILPVSFFASLVLALFLLLPDAFGEPETRSWTVQLNVFELKKQSFYIKLTPPILSEDYETEKKKQLEQARILSLQLCYENNPAASTCKISKKSNLVSDDAARHENAAFVSLDSHSDIEGVDIIQYKLLPSLRLKRKGYVHFIKEKIFTEKNESCNDKLFGQKEIAGFCNKLCGSNDKCQVDYSSVLDSAAIGSARISQPSFWATYKDSTFAAQSNCLRVVKLFCPIEF